MYMRMIALALACALAGCQEAGRDVPQGPGLRMRDSDSSVTTVPKMRLAEPTNRTGQFAQPRARLPRELFEASVAQAPPPRVASLSPASAPSLIEEPRLAAVPRTVRQASRPDDSPRPQARRRAAAPAVSRSMPPDKDEETLEFVDEDEPAPVARGRRPQGTRQAALGGFGSQRPQATTTVVPLVITPGGQSRGYRGRGDSFEEEGMQPNSQCVDKALATLKRLSPTGYAVYQRIRNKKSFTTWILCDEMQRGLTTGVHETVHMLTDQLNAYPLIDGRTLPRLAITDKLARPGLIAARFNPSDEFVKTYLLPGAASSADYFTYLLDEFNAYTHDLNTAIQTVSIAPKDSNLGHRDGLAAMMSFMMTYVARAERSEPATWKALQRPDISRTVKTLWSEAERTMERSCGIPRYAVDDQSYLNHICDPANGRALSQIIGRQPRCPRACLRASG